MSMHVWVLCRDVDYEGTTIEGLAASHELALAWLENMREKAADEGERPSGVFLE
jgi:hypothetical protein